MFIAGGVRWIAAHRPYEGSLAGWLARACLLLVGYGWLMWRASRR
jgi:hypothetical protein